MKDKFQRDITYLRLSATSLCNLRCRYCMPPEKGTEEACSVEELDAIARAAVRCGVTKIRITGGEPLVRREILDICQNTAALEGVRELCLTTNGVLLPQLANPLRDAGVSRLNISLDTLRPERFAYMTRTGRLTDVFAGIEAAFAAGFAGTKINVVLMQGFNDDEIAGFVELAARYPLEVRFIELMPIGQGEGLPLLPASAVLERCPELEAVDTAGVARRFRVPGGRGLVGLIEPLSRRFCSQCSRIRVTADGRLKPCLHTGQEILLRGLSGDALYQAFRDGIAAKPACHRLAETGRSSAGRSMNQIGG